eukprot:TRINITY_DN8460_c0_g1_i1.p2 TRINITY_DN8460_c0_g1~~TRINITY_DN8460_c0_g1_i1.p2  ORF type:complete len:303 (-),score=21.09 TRINITY_DN8460_c0_g1_i1:1325-2233(-)
MLSNLPMSFAMCRRIVVTGIAYETTDVDFQYYFERFGEVENAEIVRDRQGRSKGFGFVSFVEAASVQRVLQMPHVLDKRRIEVQEDTRDINDNRIFVARIPANITEVDFRRYFEEFGPVQDAYMPKDHTKQSYRGIGFVTFGDAATVDRVIRLQHSLGGADIKVDRAVNKPENIPTAPTSVLSMSPQPQDLSLNLSRLQLGPRSSPFDVTSPHSVFSGYENGLISPNSAMVERASHVLSNGTLSPTPFTANPPNYLQFPSNQAQPLEFFNPSIALVGILRNLKKLLGIFFSQYLFFSLLVNI